MAQRISKNASDKYRVWKSIILRTYKSANTLRKALKKSNCQISDLVNDIMGRPAFTLNTKKTKIDLVVITVGELGFKKGATLKKIYKRAKRMGLSLCPAKVALQLCLLCPQYLNQLFEPWLYIAMEPIANLGSDLDDLHIFCIKHDDDDFVLDSISGDPDGFWNTKRQWIFTCYK